MKSYLLIKFSLFNLLQILVIGILVVSLSVNNTFAQNILSATSITTPKVIKPAVPVNVTAAVCQNFGAAQNFLFFSGIGAVSNAGRSNFTGDAGSNSGAVSGFDPPSVITGGVFSETAYTTQAKIDLLKLYIHLTDISVTNSMHPFVFGSNETIKAGVYTIPGPGSMAGNLYLDANGDANAVFIIKFEGAFSPAAGSSIILVNNARKPQTKQKLILS